MVQVKTEKDETCMVVSHKPCLTQWIGDPANNIILYYAHLTNTKLPPEKRWTFVIFRWLYDGLLKWKDGWLFNGFLWMDGRTKFSFCFGSHLILSV